MKSGVLSDELFPCLKQASIEFGSRYLIDGQWKAFSLVSSTWGHAMLPGDTANLNVVEKFDMTGAKKRKTFCN